MKNNVPSQDSTRCYGKYCTHFVSKTHGKTCPSCGAYICQTCFHEKGCCRDCEDILMETQVQIDRIERAEKVGLHHDHMCICGRESKIGTNLCPDCDVDELVALGLD